MRKALDQNVLPIIDGIYKKIEKVESKLKELRIETIAKSYL